MKLQVTDHRIQLLTVNPRHERDYFPRANESFVTITGSFEVGEMDFRYKGSASIVMERGSDATDDTITVNGSVIVGEVSDESEGSCLYSFSQESPDGPKGLTLYDWETDVEPLQNADKPGVKVLTESDSDLDSFWYGVLEAVQKYCCDKL